MFVKKNFSTELDEIEVSVKGWNWGTAKFSGVFIEISFS